MEHGNETTLYFIRHGETISNIKRIRQGIQIDDYLDTQGILQTEKIIPIIKTLDLQALYTSYLHRAEESAAIINAALEKPIPIIHDSRLRERDFGSLTGHPQDYWDRLLPNNRYLEEMQTYDYRPFGGEDVQQVRERGFSAIIDIATNYEGKNVGIITHNGIIRLLLFHFPEMPRIYRGYETNKDIANTDIYELTVTYDKLQNMRALIK